jgi:mono/diheme cytochrome c family protein
MSRRYPLLAVLLLAALPVSPAVAQDVEAGRQIAQRWCSACHEIGTAPVKNDVSPSFWSIARMSSTTAMSLHAFLSTPHHRMPDYILSLKAARLDAGAK